MPLILCFGNHKGYFTCQLHTVAGTYVTYVATQKFAGALRVPVAEPPFLNF